MSPVSERAAQVRFRRALSLMAMTLVAPGTAQLLAGNRRVGTIAFRTYVGVLAVALVGAVVALAHRPFVYWLATDTAALLWLDLALMVGAVGWAVLLVDAWRIGDPLSYSLVHRRMSVGVNGLLCFSVAGTLLLGAHLVGVQRTFIRETFGDGDATGAHHGRYNVLVMGGDSGAGRWGLRPDSMNVASIDAETGRTVLIALPRNLQNFPFREGSVMDEQFPDGFDCDGCMLNGVSTWAEDNTELFPGSDSPGVDATVSAIEGVTGLRINYWAMVNLEGFRDLVDAVGGVTLNVRQEIPIGLPGDKVTGTIEPGVQKLDGFETLWFARARYGSDDYSRMARQKCVMSAMLDQISPQSALRNFQEIARASSEMVSTDLPASEVDRFLDLAVEAKGQQISTLSLVPPMIDTYRPDVGLIHRKVADAIARAEGVVPARDGSGAGSGEGSGEGGDGRGGGAPKADPKAESGPVTGGSLGSMSEGYAANHADDLASAC